MARQSITETESAKTSQVHVITVSDRCSAGIREDLSGPLAVKMLGEAGFEAQLTLVPDGIESVQEALQAAITAGARAVITTGGTGPTQRDLTPEGTAKVIDRYMPGISEGIRRAGESSTKYSVISRGLSGIVDATGEHQSCIVVNLPGSQGGVKDGITYLAPLLEHLLEQIDVATSLPDDSNSSCQPDTAATSGCGCTTTPAAPATTKHASTSVSNVALAATGVSGVQREPLELQPLIDAVAAPAMGAVLNFVGQVRDHDPEVDGVVSGLSYSAHPDADRILTECVARVVRDFPEPVRVAAVHRIGDLAVGDAALLVCAASAHRKAAFEACSKTVEEIKRTVPIWKKQHTADGQSEWVGIDCC